MTVREKLLVLAWALWISCGLLICALIGGMGNGIDTGLAFKAIVCLGGVVLFRIAERRA